MDIVPEITKKSIITLINNGQRPDGRALNERRDIFIESDVISKAEGSARVKLGDTQIIAGVKAQVGEPYEDSPNVGVLMTNCELLPMADPSFEPGPPSPQSIELARVVDRGIRESELIDLKKLCIEEGKKVWMLFVDLHVIDYDGNLFDACNLAVMAALLCTKLPTVNYVDDVIEFNKENLVELPVKDKLLLSTFVKVGDDLILDPSLDEERILDARITVGISEKGNNICSMQKGGEKPLTREEILDAVHTAFNTKNELLKYFN